MEVVLVLGACFVGAVVLLARTRRPAFDDDVPGAERRDPQVIRNEANLRLDEHRGPRGRMDGTSGTLSGGG